MRGWAFSGLIVIKCSTVDVFELDTRLEKIGFLGLKLHRRKLAPDSRI